MVSLNIKVGVFKCGNIGTAPVLELLLDELADRKDLAVRTITTGSKKDVAAVDETVGKIFEFTPDLLLLSRQTHLPQDLQRQGKYFQIIKFLQLSLRMAQVNVLERKLKVKG